MKVKLALIVIVVFSEAVYCQPRNEFNILQGDLLFQDMDCGSMCDAIEKVTRAWAGSNFSHIGLVVQKDDSLFVIEAIGKDVHLTPVSKFLYRSIDVEGNPKIVVGRLKSNHHALITNAIKFAELQLSVPYDDEFLYDNGKYYCSELIYDSFMYANNGHPFFELNPMTFNDPDTGRIFSIWTDYFKARNMEIPEGKLGCNPSGLSLSDKINIVKSLYPH